MPHNLVTTTLRHPYCGKYYSSWLSPTEILKQLGTYATVWVVAAAQVSARCPLMTRGWLIAVCLRACTWAETWGVSYRLCVCERERMSVYVWWWWWGSIPDSERRRRGGLQDEPINNIWAAGARGQCQKLKALSMVLNRRPESPLSARGHATLWASSLFFLFFPPPLHRPVRTWSSPMIHDPEDDGSLHHLVSVRARNTDEGLVDLNEWRISSRLVKMLVKASFVPHFHRSSIHYWTDQLGPDTACNRPFIHHGNPTCYK